jgi:CDP-diacylglycerol--glycerol-3-phosphate 3-phosphatidyltransferase
MFSIAAITDYYDGYFARMYGATSKYGAFLDPLADKILTFSGFIIIHFIDAGQFPVWAITAIIVRDLFTTFLRIWADKKKIHIETLRSAKVKTAVQLTFLHFALIAGIFAGTPYDVFYFARIFLYSGILGWAFIGVTLFTVYTGLEYVYINRNHIFTRANS